MKMKKSLAIALSLSMALGLTACGGGGTTADTGDTTTADTTATEDGKETVNFWHSMSGKNGEVLDQMIAKYNESQDEVEVIGTYQGGYTDSVAKTIADIAAGAGPDLLQMGSGQVVILSQDDVTANLLDYMTDESGVTLDDFVEGFYTDYLSEDGQKLNALPMGCSTPVLYVNTDILDKAGLEVPKTWEEMADTCKKLKDGGYSDFGFSQPRDIWYFWMMVETYGGPVFSEDGLKLDCLDNGSAVEAFNLLQGMVKDDTFRPAPTTEGANTIKGWFSGGECAFLVQSVGALNEIRSACEESGVNMEIAQIPGHEIDGKVHYAVPYGGNTMVMLESSQHKDAAWKFMQWLYTSEDGIAYFDDNTGYLACSGTVKNTELLKAKAANDADWARAHEYLDTIVTDYLIEASGDVVEDLTAFMDAVFYDAEDPKTALEEQRANVEEILADHEGRP